MKTSRAWRGYFRRNSRSLLEIPWGAGVQLTVIERGEISASVQAFQLGETGGGSHLLRCGEGYAARTGDQEYLEALRLFIAEEQRHGDDLGRFLDAAGIPRLRKSWINGFFRWLRHRAGLELTVSALLTAEIIAKVYYAALRKATSSAVLRILCEQILKDEVAHVRFQSERLAMLRERRPRWMLPSLHAFERCFFLGTCLVVWCSHGRALRAGGYSFRKFWRSVRREYDVSQAMRDPRVGKRNQPSLIVAE